MKVTLLKRAMLPRADRPGQSRLHLPPETVDVEDAIGERLIRLGVAQKATRRRTNSED